MKRLSELHLHRLTGNLIGEQLLVENLAEVKYELNFQVQECNL